MVKPGGAVYAWVYPRERALRETVMGALRSVTTRLPGPAMRTLSFALAPLTLAVRSYSGTQLGRATWNECAQVVHDWLAPPLQSHHDWDEVAGWARAAGLGDLERLPIPVGITAWRPRGGNAPGRDRVSRARVRGAPRSGAVAASPCVAGRGRQGSAHGAHGVRRRRAAGRPTRARFGAGGPDLPHHDHVEDRGTFGARGLAHHGDGVARVLVQARPSSSVVRRSTRSKPAASACASAAERSVRPTPWRREQGRTARPLISA